MKGATSEPGDLIRRLSAVQDQMLSLAADAFSQRWQLRKQQDILRIEAQRFSYAMYEDTFDDELLAQLLALRSQMKAIEKQRIDLVSQSGSSGAGTIDQQSHSAVKMNLAMDNAAGLPEIKDRIGRIKGVLSDRGVSIPVPD